MSTYPRVQADDGHVTERRLSRSCEMLTAVSRGVSELSLDHSSKLFSGLSPGSACESVRQRVALLGSRTESFHSLDSGDDTPCDAVLGLLRRGSQVRVLPGAPIINRLRGTRHGSGIQ